MRLTMTLVAILMVAHILVAFVHSKPAIRRHIINKLSALAALIRKDSAKQNKELLQEIVIIEGASNERGLGLAVFNAVTKGLSYFIHNSVREMKEIMNDLLQKVLKYNSAVLESAKKGEVLKAKDNESAILLAEIKQIVVLLTEKGEESRFSVLSCTPYWERCTTTIGYLVKIFQKVQEAVAIERNMMANNFAELDKDCIILEAATLKILKVLTPYISAYQLKADL